MQQVAPSSTKSVTKDMLQLPEVLLAGEEVKPSTWSDINYYALELITINCHKANTLSYIGDFNLKLKGII